MSAADDNEPSSLQLRAQRFAAVFSVSAFFYKIYKDYAFCCV